MNNLMTEVLVGLLLISGAVLHGVTGLGFPMISTMSVAIMYHLPVAIALVVLPNVIINMMVLVPRKNAPREEGIIFFIQKFWPLMVSSVIGCVIGVMLLKQLPMQWMYLLLSTATLFYIFYTLYNNRKGRAKAVVTVQSDISSHQRYNHLQMIFFGGLAGIIGGATNAMSSVLMMYLLAHSDNKNEIVKTSNFCFLLAKIVQIILLKDELANMESQAIWALLIITLLSVIALFIGIRIRDKISIEIFKKFVLLMLLVLALRAAWKAMVLFLQ